MRYYFKVRETLEVQEIVEIGRVCVRMVLRRETKLFQRGNVSLYWTVVI